MFRHEFVIPQWEFALGEGNDILDTLHYYAVGDPLAALSIFVPTGFMPVFYGLMAVFRLYLAGISFSCLCFGTGKKDRTAVLAGSMAYVFSYWGLHCVARHPFFLNPMIYLPLLVLGVEKIIHRKKPYLFIVTVCLSAMSNFYFFYMLALLTVIYTVTRLLVSFHKNYKEMFLALLRVGASSVLGVLLSAVIFLPVCAAFLEDARISVERVWHLFYPSKYYSKIAGLFLAQGTAEWLCMGYAVPVFLAVGLLFYKRKQNTLLKTLFLVNCVLILFPAFGKILNGFSYASNRWSFAPALLAAYILAVMWPSLMELHWKEGIFLSGCAAAYLAVCMVLEKSRTKEVFLLTALLWLLLIVLLPVREGKAFLSARQKKLAVFAFLFCSVFCNSFWRYYVEGYAAHFLTPQTAERSLSKNETAAVLAAAQADGTEGFYRYSGRGMEKNNGLPAGLSSTCFYWSLSNLGISQYREQLGMLEYKLFDYRGYDDRSIPLALSSVLYYAIPAGDTDALPYGYSYVDTYPVKGTDGYQIYRNDYALPLGYAYSECLSQEAFESLDAVEKQEAMLSAVLLDGAEGTFDGAEPSLDSREISYEADCGKGVSVKQGKFVVKSKNASVTLYFDGLAGCTAYVSLTGLHYDGKAETGTVQVQSPAGTTRRVNYSNIDSHRYSGRHNFTFDMGYSEEAVTSVTITFSAKGTYSFDALRVFCQPMDAYGEKLEALKEDVLENVEIGTNLVTGTIALDEPKFLCLSIPYSKGWSAYVDGEEATLYQANLKNMAVALKAGEHKIELRYQTPLLKEGFFVSLCGLVLFAAVIVVMRRKADLSIKK